MCGICGIFNINNKPVNKMALLKMTRLIRHRGPDDEGFLIINTNNGNIEPCHHDETIKIIKNKTKHLNYVKPGNFAFGFRRLSIIDLSANGHQPMKNKDGSIWIVFNGEIYNYIELRNELNSYGYKFHTNTDTEVVINAYHHWGENCLDRFNGMWAFALWDKHQKKIFCARDRFGIKPFYYYYDGKRFIFSSEIKQLLVHPINRTLNKKMIYRSMNLNSFLSYHDETFFEKIHSLPHSHYLTIKNNSLIIKQYYDLSIKEYKNVKPSFNDSVMEYDKIFKDSIKLRMRSDVEVGSCLSGGLDSSAIVSIASTLTDKRFKTYSTYYDEGSLFDERKWIRIVNKATNSQGYLIEPKVEDFIRDFEYMTFVNDYPLIGPSVISQNYVMKLASENGTTVILDGQGSDEILAGYNHSFYRYYADLLKSFKLKKFVDEFPNYLKYNKKGNSVEKLLKVLLSLFFNEVAIYNLESKYQINNLLSYSYKRENIFDKIQNLNTSKLTNFLYNLVMTTMLQTLLHFEDRNSMAYSIESRVPFLDYRLVEFVFTLPNNYKIHGNYGKYIHRKALGKIAPKEIAERKDKIGFSSPAEIIWLRGSMKPLIDDIFNSGDYKNRDIFNHKLIQKKYKEYLNGNNKNGKFIWRVITLEQWFRTVYEQ